MKALVTGGAGFIGSALAKALVDQGHDVAVLDSLITGSRENIPEKAHFIHEDLRNAPALAKACRGREIVFHQAAIRSVPRSVEDPFAANEANVAGTLNLLDAAANAGVRRLVYASSSSVYGDAGKQANREDMPTNPQSPYAVSKLAGENYCRVWAGLGRLSTVCLRYFNVYGPGQRAESMYAAVFPAFVSALLRKRAPEVHSDGRQSRDFSYIDDVVAANLAAARAGDEAGGGVFNVGGGSPKTVNEVLRAVSDAAGIWIDPLHLPARPGDVRHTKADLALAGRVLEWHPRADWESSVAETVRWFKSRL
ncbi:MAG: NAD-dependent epimerase/dehydratase family protein [Actinomycetota bacterium]